MRGAWKDIPTLQATQATEPLDSEAWATRATEPFFKRPRTEHARPTRSSNPSAPPSPTRASNNAARAATRRARRWRSGDRRGKRRLRTRSQLGSIELVLFLRRAAPGSRCLPPTGRYVLAESATRAIVPIHRSPAHSMPAPESADNRLASPAYSPISRTAAPGSNTTAQISAAAPRQLDIPLGALRQGHIGAAITNAAHNRRRGMADQKEFHDASTAR